MLLFTTSTLMVLVVMLHPPVLTPASSGRWLVRLRQQLPEARIAAQAYEVGGGPHQRCRITQRHRPAQGFQCRGPIAELERRESTVVAHVGIVGVQLQGAAGVAPHV